MQVQEPISKVKHFQEIFSRMPEKLQQEVIDFMEFLLMKEMDTNPGFFFYPELKDELRERLREAEEHPEDLIDEEDVKKEWEQKLGISL